MLSARSSAAYAPAAAQSTSWGREINALVVTDGVMIAGYGDWGSNTGPIKPGELPVTGSTWTQGASLATEAVHLLRVLADGRVLAPAIDPQGGGSPTGSNYGERDPVTGLWTDRINRISQLGAHFFDIVECDGHLFAAGAAYETTYGTGNAGGAIWESDDDGATWSLSYSHFGPTPAFDLDRFYYLAVVGDEVFARASPSGPEVKWTLADGWETSTGLPSAGQPGKAFRGGWVVPVEEPVAQPLYLFDGSTSTLFAESVVVWDVGDDGALYYVDADFMLRTVPATGALTPVDVQQLDGSVGLYTSMAALPGSESFVLGTANSQLVILEVPAMLPGAYLLPGIALPATQNLGEPAPLNVIPEAKTALTAIIDALPETDGALVRQGFPTDVPKQVDRVYVLRRIEDGRREPANQQGALEETYTIRVLIQARTYFPADPDGAVAEARAYEMFNAIDTAIRDDRSLNGAVIASVIETYSSETGVPEGANDGWITEISAGVACMEII